MLILMRRAGESIHIGRDIVITLISLERNRARIGIQAPRHVTVDREEIAKRKQDELEELYAGEEAPDDTDGVDDSAHHAETDDDKNEPD